MSDRDALLAAIAASPADDTPRLVFADWLDEHDATEQSPCSCAQYLDNPDNPFRGIPGYRPERDPASGRHEGGWSNCKTCNSGGGTPGWVVRSNGFGVRAEFVRVGCELAQKALPIVRCGGASSQGYPAEMKAGERATFTVRTEDIANLKAGRQIAVHETFAPNEYMRWFGIIEVIHGFVRESQWSNVTIRLYPEPEELAELRRRERELLHRRGRAWLNQSAQDGWEAWGCKDSPYAWRIPPSEEVNVFVGFSRGFLSRVRCSWSDAASHLDSILADPWVPGLDEVELTTWPLRPLPIGHYINCDFDGAEPQRVIIRESGTLAPVVAGRGVAFSTEPGETREVLLTEILEALWPKEKVRSWTLPPEPREEPQTDPRYFHDFVEQASRDIAEVLGVPASLLDPTPEDS